MTITRVGLGDFYRKGISTLTLISQFCGRIIRGESPFRIPGSTLVAVERIFWPMKTSRRLPKIESVGWGVEAACVAKLISPIGSTCAILKSSFVTSRQDCRRARLVLSTFFSADEVHRAAASCVCCLACVAILGSRTSYVQT